MSRAMGFFAKLLGVRTAKPRNPTAGSSPLGGREVDFSLLTENGTDVICRRGPLSSSH